MTTHNYLIIGGTGKTGRKVVNNLKELGLNVKVGSRNASPKFDWQDSNTWSEALENIDKVYITFQPDLAVPGALQAIENLSKLAKEKGVKKLVILSGKGETEAEACEQVVMNSGIDYTIVRASWFNQNFSESFFLDPILSGQVNLPCPEAKVPYVDTSDIADVVTEALLHDEHNGKIYEITGPRLLTFEEVISEIAKVTNRDIQFNPINLEQYIGFLKDNDVPADYVWLIDYLFSNVLTNPNNSVVSHDVEKVLKRKAKDFSDYVTETAATGVWNVN
ncbi:NmrA family NAD(P)-binding protein [Seonamhaeicola marinus]|uniref:NAD(P)H-binding protein n=1 Tax=Seonamhaeicola marinus TaxID=1912246 RepID=A0A5D0HEU8_9FLAO|nr:NAD(P)H-binding protein [Seonamhaeicola marinus]TYA69898.1 NAD(P)H-binding protein [Seonamhaeicola marinus]